MHITSNEAPVTAEGEFLVLSRILREWFRSKEIATAGFTAGFRFFGVPNDPRGARSTFAHCFKLETELRHAGFSNYVIIGLEHDRHSTVWACWPQEDGPMNASWANVENMTISRCHDLRGQITNGRVRSLLGLKPGS